MVALAARRSAVARGQPKALLKSAAPRRACRFSGRIARERKRDKPIYRPTKTLPLHSQLIRTPRQHQDSRKLSIIKSKLIHMPEC
jgi:hypothetical protein